MPRFRVTKDISAIPLPRSSRVENRGGRRLGHRYGSDAVGGVGNIFVLKRDFEGADTNVNIGSVTKGSLHDTEVAKSPAMSGTRGSDC